jgi:hypothetical protein
MVVLEDLRVEEAAAWAAYLAVFAADLAARGALAAAVPRMPPPVAASLAVVVAAVGRLPAAGTADLALPGGRHLATAVFWLAAAEEWAAHRGAPPRPADADAFRRRLLSALIPALATL